MKISKLFHWLYAILMLLPFAFFIPSVLYYAFNDNSTMQTVEVPKKETIAVDFNQQVTNYLFEDTQDWVGNSGVNFNVTTNNNVLSLSTDLDGDYYLQYIFNNIPGHKYLYKVSFMSTVNDDKAFCFIFRGNPSSYVIQYKSNANCDGYFHTFEGVFTGVSGNIPYFRLMFGMNNNVNNFMYPQLYDLTQMYGVGNEPTLEQFNQIFSDTYYPYTESELMQITYDTGETEQLVQNIDIVNYAWESIWDLPLFNWCKVSFVAVPFTYITGLFGLAASNSFNYVFTYFASMSIIWLVFDVIMYVPLLVHRWLDKGIVE